ncbi:hypothetical protein JTE90_001648 [Oedothorax gibbosus]|uniref:Aminoacyl-transfer RNA synthetases class-II family profile domain-containing protein n=1 Tax=Oedothorax gibbosus TaxID=931172 RepID=A0AAV6VQE5_9ARAC|nr:hypothetical protein JTE90_001648 [Oedothorax gibbosus]
MFLRQLHSKISNKTWFTSSMSFCSNLNSFTWRSHTCGELNTSHIGQDVTICGWTTYQRMDKFVILRDAYGVTQVIFKDNDHLSKKFIDSLPLESVIQVKGKVRKRPQKNLKKNIATGFIEVEAEEVKLLNSSTPKLPITSKDQEKLTETVNYKYRYLSLRSQKLQENLRIRSKVLMKMREFLHDQHNFVDIETPTLFKRTPGGAKEFIVPTKFPGKFYSLTQSPQQFKQLLMIAGLDRYFQIARCYRNEGTKSDRQPEFTQVDIEMSFTTAKDIQLLIEQLLKYSWPYEKHGIKPPFPCMKYEDAMRYYGTDKPDLRYEIKLQDLTAELKDSGLQISEQSKLDSDYIISCILVPRGAKLIKNSFIKELQKLAETPHFIPISIKEDLTWNSAISKHVSEEVRNGINQKLMATPGDLVFLAAGKSTITQTTLGKTRVKCAEYLQSNNFEIFQPKTFAFVWITDFPLFLRDKNGKLESAHHPFTAPYMEDIDLIYTDPCKARSLHYDLVLNGQEVGGGSIRIHDANLQKYILEDILEEDPSSLQHLLDALNSGCPPHGGIALGIDRLLAIICDCQSIKDVIAFPKSLDGKDLMSGAPCTISNEEKILYHIEPIMPVEQS